MPKFLKSKFGESWFYRFVVLCFWLQEFHDLFESMADDEISDDVTVEILSFFGFPILCDQCIFFVVMDCLCFQIDFDKFVDSDFCDIFENVSDIPDSVLQQAFKSELCVASKNYDLVKALMKSHRMLN